MKRWLPWLFSLLAWSALAYASESRDGGMVLPKLYGPDLSGAYGWLQGVGGFEAIKPGEAVSVLSLSDALGHVHGHQYSHVYRKAAERAREAQTQKIDQTQIQP